MSALPPKADILRVVAKCPLLTQSGHSKIVRFIGGVMTVTPNFIYFVLKEDRGKGFVGLNPCGSSMGSRTLYYKTVVMVSFQ